MFKIEAYVEDRRVGDALRALAGIAKGQPKVIPVVNVEEDGEDLKASTNGTLVEMLMEHLRKSHTAHITPKEIQAWLKTVGFSPASASYALRSAKDAGYLRSSGKSAAIVYHVKETR